MSDEPQPLYEADFILWTQEQAGKLLDGRAAGCREPGG
jgi:hypothetical protein